MPRLRPIEALWPVQREAVRHIVSNPSSMIWADMGAGKTIMTLTAFMFLRSVGKANKMLVVAPARVCTLVWAQQAQEWEHTAGLKFSTCLGPEKRRLQGLFAPADVYLINYESLAWLSKILKQYFTAETLPFQMVAWDEVSKMKHATSGRSKAMFPLLPWFKHKVGLTGTPCSNGLMDLHGQYLAVDEGVRLLPYITHYRDRWFVQNPYNRKYTPLDGAQSHIESLIHDITFQIKLKDNPAPSFIDVTISLPPTLRKQYNELEKEMAIEVEDTPVEVFNAAALSSKCQQFSNGNMYISTETRETVRVHDLKIKAVEEIMEGIGGKPLLLGYSFRSDVVALRKKWPDLVNLSGLRGQELEQAQNDWNAGNIRLLVGHPASMGHGLNLQKGGHHIAWFGLPWALDLYAQMNARLARTGQTDKVMCYRIIVQDTVEDLVTDALTSKQSTEDSVKDALKAYAAKIKKENGL